MKTLIFILIIASFLQTTIIPVDLCLLILVCRSYLKTDKNNLLLAFIFGLLIGHLNLRGLGFQSLIYLSSVVVTGVLSRLRFAGNPLLIIPLVFILLLLNGLISLFLAHEILDFSRIIISSFLSLPLLYLIRLWEERFTVQKEIKLKI